MSWAVFWGDQQMFGVCMFKCLPRLPSCLYTLRYSELLSLPSARSRKWASKAFPLSNLRYSERACWRVKNSFVVPRETVRQRLRIHMFGTCQCSWAQLCQTFGSHTDRTTSSECKLPWEKTDRKYRRNMCESSPVSPKNSNKNPAMLQLPLGFRAAA